MRENLVTETQPPSLAPGGLKLKTAAAYLGISTISLRRLIARGLIRPNRSLRHLLIDRRELDRFLAR
jgi:excisionase family DNA binding protein